jgi:pimeloyl-ACP methyl ester carboxylesterase
MISQCLIGPNRLLGVLHHPVIQGRNQCVLLLPGFSLSMCDVDYFMSRLARYLCRQGFHVLQMDPRGHGDSGGCLEEVTLDSLRNDISEGIDFLSSSLSKSVYIVSRGFHATLSSEFVKNGKALGVVGIGPYCLSNTIAQSLWSGLDTKECYTGMDLIPGSEYRTLADFDQDKLAFFNALGARLRNILGQEISAQLLHEIIKYDPSETFRSTKEKTCWYFHADEAENNIVQWTFTPSSPSIDLQEYASNAFRRDPVWQFNIMNAVDRWLEENGR